MQINFQNVKEIYSILEYAKEKSDKLEKALGLFFSIFQRSYKENPDNNIDLLLVLHVILKKDIGYNYKPEKVISCLRIFFCHYNKEWFSEYYLDSWDISRTKHQAKWRKNWNRRRHLIQAPRSHGKSRVFSLELPLWNICYKDNIRILMASETDTQAVTYLSAIKGALEMSEKIIEDFGDLAQKVNPLDGSLLEGGKGKNKWSNNQIYCRRTNPLLKDGTVRAIGWTSAITGARFDLIILDDPITKEACSTAKKRDKQLEKLFVLDDLLEADGQMLVIGTRKHSDDLYQRLMDKQSWTYSVDRAIVSPDLDEIKYKRVIGWDEDLQQETVIDIDIIYPKQEEIKVLWDYKWNIKKLLLKKETTTTSHFLSEYQNIINSEETALFKKRDIENCEDIKQLGHRVSFYKTRPEWAKYVICAFDLSAEFNKYDAERKDNDYFCGIVGAIDQKNKLHIIYAHRERGIDSDDQLSLIQRIYYDYKIDVGVLETNAYQKSMQSRVLKAGIPIMPHNTGREKSSFEMGIPNMSIMMKTGQMVFYTDGDETSQFYDVLKGELHDWGKAKHDDTAMALWLLTIAHRRIMDKERIKQINKNRRENRGQKKTLERIEKEVQEVTCPQTSYKKNIDKKTDSDINEMLKRFNINVEI